MSGRRLNTRQLFAIAALALGITAGSSSRAFANIHYRVWYFDAVYETYQTGDITDGKAETFRPCVHGLHPRRPKPRDDAIGAPSAGEHICRAVTVRGTGSAERSR